MDGGSVAPIWRIAQSQSDTRAQDRKTHDTQTSRIGIGSVCHLLHMYLLEYVYYLGHVFCSEQIEGELIDMNTDIDVILLFLFAASSIAPGSQARSSCPTVLPLSLFLVLVLLLSHLIATLLLKIDFRSTNTLSVSQQKCVDEDRFGTTAVSLRARLPPPPSSDRARIGSERARLEAAPSRLLCHCHRCQLSRRQH